MAARKTPSKKRPVKKAVRKAPAKRSRKAKAAPVAPPKPPEVLRTRVIVREVATKHQTFLDGYHKRPKASKSKSGAINQILSLFPVIETKLETVTADRDELERRLRFYVDAAKASGKAGEREASELADLVAFVKSRPIDYQRQLSIPMPFEEMDDDDDDDEG